MMGEVVRLKSGVSIREFKQRLTKLPISVSHAISAQAAPLLTRFAQQANAARENVYGDAYPDGKQYTYVPGVYDVESFRDSRGRLHGRDAVRPGAWDVRDGAQLDLVFSGDTQRQLRFVVNGTLIRCALGPRYAKYLIGKYKILPIGDRTSMPVAWVRALDELVRTVQDRPSLVAA